MIYSYLVFWFDLIKELSHDVELPLNLRPNDDAALIVWVIFDYLPGTHVYPESILLNRVHTEQVSLVYLDAGTFGAHWVVRHHFNRDGNIVFFRAIFERCV